MTTTDQFRIDAEWLRDFAGQLARDIGSDDATRLKHIADSMDIAAGVMFTPSLILEKRVEEFTAKWIEGYLGDRPIKDHEEIQLFLWLIYQALKSSGNKALLGQGLAGLGLGALFGAVKGKQPIDPEDK